MNAGVHRRLNRRQRRILRRPQNQPGVERPEPRPAAAAIRQEPTDRTRAIAPGGIGAIPLPARKLGLVRDIDEGLRLRKRHLPYHESDHVLNIADDLLAGGSRLEHIEVRRNDAVDLDALGAGRIPGPATAGDFGRRSSETDARPPMGLVDEARSRAWSRQPDAFFDGAFLDADGTVAPSDGRCKQGADIADNGVWGYRPPAVTPADTGAPPSLVNRRGDRPSHEHADGYLDQAAALCRRGGSQRITIRGDPKSTQTKHPDRRDRGSIRFILGRDARDDLEDLAGRRDDLRYTRHGSSSVKRLPSSSPARWRARRPTG